MNIIVIICVKIFR